MEAEMVQSSKARVVSRERRGSSEPAARSGARLPELDRIIHERMRLAIVSALAANDTLSFAELKSLLGTTDGNLSVHARKLEEAGYLSCKKSFEARMPKTEYRLTAEGRRAFAKYVDHLEALVRRSRKA
jgi:DNA-binding HxlR family transcriptional regulator